VARRSAELHSRRSKSDAFEQHFLTLSGGEEGVVCKAMRSTLRVFTASTKSPENLALPLDDECFTVTHGSGHDDA